MSKDDKKKSTLPKVEVVSVFLVVCASPQCGPVGQHKKRSEAEAIKARHLDAHNDHEEAVRKMLEGLDADKEDAANNGITLVPGLHCTTCNASIGETHLEKCDVARCLKNGGQRRLTSHVPAGETDHNCGEDVWTGYYPGEREAAMYGVPLGTLKQHGYWSVEKMEWILPDDWAEKLNAEQSA